MSKRPDAPSDLWERIHHHIAHGGPIDGLISEALGHQRQAIPLIERFLSASGIDADAPWWQQAIPTDFFRRATLFAGPPETIIHRFYSSGTSGGDKSLAAYSQRGLDLMAQSIYHNAKRMLFPDGQRTRIFVLAPPPSRAPAMIMAWGMDQLIRHFSLPGGSFLWQSTGLDFENIAERLRQNQDEGVATTLIGASFSFVHFLDHLAAKNQKITLLPGSRIMHAGGFKGRSREIPPAKLQAQLSKAFNLANPFILNTLGMTELATQFYDDTLAAHLEERDAKDGKTNPPWTQTEIIDPNTLTPVAPGERGILVHLDLANFERPIAIRTSDIGLKWVDGFEIQGRLQGADAAGCSVTVDEFLQGENRG